MGAFFGRLIRAFSAFFRWLFGSPTKPAPESNVSDPPHVAALRVRPVFVDIDVGEFATRHDLEKLGRERGLQNLPPSEASFPDVIESQIVREVETRMKDACAEYQRAAESYGLAAREAEIEALSARVADAATETITDLIALWRSCGDRVYTLRENARENKANLEKFRKDNELSRPAFIPISWIPQLFALLLLLSIETWANGSVLAAGLPGGLLQGWSIAAILAGLNTIVAFLLGLKVGYTGHRRLSRKLVGWGILILWAAWAVTLNLLIAHYRDALGGADPDNAGRAMLANFRRHPLQIADFQSLMLLAVGFIFSVAGFIDGTRMDDGYPGYGHLTREYEQRLDEFRTEKEDQIEILTLLKDERIKQIRLDTDYGNSLRARVAEECDRLRALRDLLNRHLDAIAFSGLQLVEIYRQANRRSRTAPEPSYFSARPSFTRPASCDFSAIDEAIVPAPLNGAGPREITDKFREIIESFPTLDELK